jgi:hypothetical protein
MIGSQSSVEQNDDSSTLVAALLSPVMFYLAGRLDSADRRATLVAASAIAFLGFMESRPNVSLVPLQGFQFVMAPMVLSLFSAGASVWALFPRNAISDDWVSKIFLGRHSSEDVLETMKSSNHTALAGLIMSQTLLGKVIRRKNKFSWWGGAALVFAFVLYILGNALCWI